MRRTPQSRAACGDDRRGTPVDRREVAVDQGVDEEVHDVDAHAGAPHGVLVEQVAAHHLGVAGPRDVAQLRGVAHEAAHGVALGQEPRGQPPADVAGGAGDEMSHGSMLPCGGRVGMSTDDVGPLAGTGCAGSTRQGDHGRVPVWRSLPPVG